MMLIFFVLAAVFLPSISCSTCLNSNFHQSIIVEEGTSVQLECYAGDKINLSIKWHMEPFPNSTNRNTILPNREQSYYGNVLKLPSVTRHQHGIYICSVNDRDESTSRYFRVTVNYKPIIIETLRIDRFENKKLELRCNAESQPPAIVRWIRDGSEVGKNVYELTHIITNREFSDTINSTLIEPGFSIDSYTDYKCVFENQVGTVIVSFRATQKESTPSKSSNYVNYFE